MYTSVSVVILKADHNSLTNSQWVLNWLPCQFMKDSNTICRDFKQQDKSNCTIRLGSVPQSSIEEGSSLRGFIYLFILFLFFINFCSLKVGSWPLLCFVISLIWWEITQMMENSCFTCCNLEVSSRWLADEEDNSNNFSYVTKWLERNFCVSCLWNIIDSFVEFFVVGKPVARY